MRALDTCRLYTFVDTAYVRGRDVVELTRELCEGGSDIVQLRAKGWGPEQVRATAEAIVPITRAAKVGLVINDFPVVAKEVGADFCHLGQEDYFDAGLRADVPFGLSSHAPEQANRALEARPSYIAIGPVYATGTKPGAKPVGLDYVRWAAANVKIPWFAIGGITMGNVDGVIAAGARRICVVSAILNAPRVREACHAFAERIGSAPLN